MHDFFRKEALSVFTERFLPPGRGIDAWRIKSNVIFQAKNQASRNLGVVLIGGTTTVTVRLEPGNKISIIALKGKKLPKFVWGEQNIAAALASSKDSDEYRIAEALCKAHAVCSSNSPFISGCATNNFSASSQYAGHKLHLKLRVRIPFVNPLCSGSEKECFLIGSVLNTDCTGIRHLGETRPGKADKTGFVLSLIPCASGAGSSSARATTVSSNSSNSSIAASSLGPRARTPSI